MLRNAKILSCDNNKKIKKSLSRGQGKQQEDVLLKSLS
ncbi:hypothetical protein CP082626L3_1058 [Chlamydia psittaci 08-2626_L3]|nr:hypothetical protein CP082626L3_1058 [Chlamydia psittaci 08-2626_L3]